MNVLVIGVGYVGKSIAQLLAKQHRVFVYDIDVDKANALVREVDSNIEVLPSDLSHTDKRFDLAIVCVPTDFDEESHHFDTSKVNLVVDQIAKNGITPCVAIKSTLPVGHSRSLQEDHPDLVILFSPEFLREATALEDCLFPSRIVVGYEKGNEKAQKCAENFANALLFSSKRPECPVSLTGLDEAEAIKLFSNTYLALRVAYFNELDTYAMFHGLDAKDIVKNVCLDPRIGNDYNNPSFGYGGYCLPKDSKELLHSFDAIPQTIIDAIVSSNKMRKEAIADQILEQTKLLPVGATIGIYRLAMKKGSDNFRQSAVLDVMGLLKEKGANLIIYEPQVQGDSFQGIPIVSTLAEFKKRSALIVANRPDAELEDVKNKVFTRDLFSKD